MRSNYQDVLLGLDQLFFTPLLQGETAKDRAQTIEAFLANKEWTWDNLLERIGQDNDTRGTNRTTQ